MTVIAIPKILRDKLSDEGAEALVQMFDKVDDRSQKVTLEIAEERFEKRLSQVEGNLLVKIAQSEARIIRWMFIFWVGQFASIVGTLSAILFAFFKR